jgi:hypothetical protein
LRALCKHLQLLLLDLVLLLLLLSLRAHFAARLLPYPQLGAVQKGI